MATMKDVAKKAGVSISTVSYVLSGSRPISNETKTLVLKAMQELNFQPNFVARALASRHSGVIALIFSPTERGLGVTELEFVKAASEAARAQDYHMILLTEGMDDPKDLRFLKQQGLVDQVILMEVRLNDERIDILEELNFSYVMIGQSNHAIPGKFVDIDFDTTMRDTLVHLQDLGHKHIAFLNQPLEKEKGGYGPAVRSDAAFHRLVKENNLIGSTICCHATPKDGYEALMSLFIQDPSITALICMNDRALPGVLQALSNRNLRIPEDISIVAAVSSEKIAQMMVPPLTSTDWPSVELAKMAVSRLVTPSEDQQNYPESLIPCQLNIRESTAKVRGFTTLKEETC